MLDLVIGVIASENTVERWRSRRSDTVFEAAIDEIPLALAERHPGAAVQKFAKSLNILWRDADRTRRLALGIVHPV
jgi:hypothetical protein